jgi:electron transport complex protein RnfD
MLGAIFMATDYATSPATAWGQIFYGIGCGVLTVIFRYFGLFPEGVTYAILLMNLFVWVIDRYTAPRVYGHKKGGAPRA